VKTIVRKVSISWGGLFCWQKKSTRRKTGIMIEIGEVSMRIWAGNLARRRLRVPHVTLKRGRRSYFSIECCMIWISGFISWNSSMKNTFSRVVSLFWCLRLL